MTAAINRPEDSILANPGAADVDDAVRHIGDGGISVWLEAPGIMRVKLPEYAEVASSHAMAAAQLIRTLACGKKYPVLVDVTRVNSVSPNSREAYDKPQSALAYAVLGNSPVDRVLAHFFLRDSPGGLPSKYFESEEEALQWLGSIRDEP